MENGDVIAFDGQEYEVISRYYRTRGGANQALTVDKDSNTEGRRIFYIVQSGGLFWVKEYVSMDFGDIKAEYGRMQQCDGIVVGNDMGEARSVKPYCLDGNRILMEYCGCDFHRLTDIMGHISDREIQGIRSLAELWRKHPDTVSDYDMSKNNIMVKISGNDLSVVFLDLELSMRNLPVNQVL